MSDSDSYSSSSEDCSDYSSDDERYGKKIAGSAAAPTHRAVVSKSVPSNVHSQLATNAGKLRDMKPETVTYHYNLKVPLKVLRAQADKGQKLELTLENGAINKVTYSNPQHGTAGVHALGDIDILCGETKCYQSNNLGATFLISTPVPVPHGTHVADVKSTKTANEHAPHGVLSFLARSKETETFTRNLTPNQLDFIEQYPGQTAKDVDNFAYPAGDSGKAHLRARPHGVPLHFYNNLEAVIKNNMQITDSMIDAEGVAYGNMEYAEEASKLAKAALRAEIAYGNTTNPKRSLPITVAAPFVNELGLDGKSVLKQPSLIEYIANHPALDATKDKYKMSPEQLRQRLDQTSLHIEGSVTYSYHKVPKNFEYQ